MFLIVNYNGKLVIIRYLFNNYFLFAITYFFVSVQSMNGAFLCNLSEFHDK